MIVECRLRDRSFDTEVRVGVGRAGEPIVDTREACRSPAGIRAHGVCGPPRGGQRMLDEVVEVRRIGRADHRTSDVLARHRLHREHARDILIACSGSELRSRTCGRIPRRSQRAQDADDRGVACGVLVSSPARERRDRQDPVRRATDAKRGQRSCAPHVRDEQLAHALDRRGGQGCAIEHLFEEVTERCRPQRGVHCLGLCVGDAPCRHRARIGVCELRAGDADRRRDRGACRACRRERGADFGGERRLGRRSLGRPRRHFAIGEARGRARREHAEPVGVVVRVEQRRERRGLGRRRAVANAEHDDVEGAVLCADRNPGGHAGGDRGVEVGEPRGRRRERDRVGRERARVVGCEPDREIGRDLRDRGPDRRRAVRRLDHDRPAVRQKARERRARPRIGARRGRCSIGELREIRGARCGHGSDERTPRREILRARTPRGPRRTLGNGELGLVRIDVNLIGIDAHPQLGGHEPRLDADRQ